MMNTRVSEDEENEGLDLSEHGQPAAADFQNVVQERICDIEGDAFIFAFIQKVYEKEK